MLPLLSTKLHYNHDAMAVQQHVLNWLYSVLTSVCVSTSLPPLTTY